MRFPGLALLFSCAMLAANALAATTTAVIDVASGTAVQRFLYVRPDAPVANIIAIPGGDGILGIQNDGTMGTNTATCSPFARNRLAFAERGFSVSLVDATSTGSVYNFDDIREVIRYVQARDNVPTWIIGGSSSTAIALNLVANLPAGSPVAGVFFSPSAFSSPLAASIRRPSLVVYHEQDTGQVGPALFGALTAATPRERSVLTGGSNSGCGYHLFNGIDAALVAAVAGFIDRYNPTLQATPNFQALWWRSPGGSENGWGVNVAQQGDILFATWYTYDLDGSAMWLFSDAHKSAENTFTGQIYQSRGSPFLSTPYESSRFVASAVGSLTLAFTDENNGTFTYTVNGLTQTKPITRYNFAPNAPTCKAGTSTSPNNYQDLWWRAPGGSENGWGVNIAHQGDVLFATWYTYGADGTDLWMVMSNAVKIADRTYRGEIHRTTSAPFNAYDQSRFSATLVGTGTFTFTDGENGTFTYTIDGVTQSKPITRYVFSTPPTTCTFPAG